MGKIPREILDIMEKLHKAGFKAYLIGGCVRDLMLNIIPKDWDITTSARPNQIQKIFPDSVYENNFGTVAIKSGKIKEPRPKGWGGKIKQEIEIVEITTFRLEGKYTDKRHPDEIKFADTIEDDLERRDFTINAMAMDAGYNLIDPYGGQKDIKNKIIRAVGDPSKRFNEDALRLMRAIRFAAWFDFPIEGKTLSAIKKAAISIKMIAQERVGDELKKIIMTSRAVMGIELMRETGLLRFIMPELEEGWMVGQNKHHRYSVWEHGLRALDYSVKKNYSLEVRLASLLHDIGKPRTKAGIGLNSTFYNHEIVGAKIASRLLNRLRFSVEERDKIVHLVRYHLFYYNVGEVTAAGVRRFLRRVGLENIDDLIKVREADRIGSGVPKAIPYKLRHLLFMVEKVRRDPLSPKMLKINGNDIMNLLKIPPGLRVGWIISILLDEVLDDPVKNTEKYLKARAQELGKSTDNELEKMAKVSREKKSEFESGVEEEMKKKFYVK